MLSVPYPPNKNGPQAVYIHSWAIYRSAQFTRAVAILRSARKLNSVEDLLVDLNVSLSLSKLSPAGMLPAVESEGTL